MKRIRGVAAVMATLALSGLALACGGGASNATIVQDVVVHLDSGGARSPLNGPSARLSGAAKEVRELLGHSLAVEIDAAIAPDDKGVLDHALTQAFEQLATELARWKTQDPAALEAAKKRLVRIVVRYDPSEGHGAWSRDMRAALGEDGQVVVTKSRKSAGSGDIIPVGIVLSLLDRASEDDAAAGFASLDPRSVPTEKRALYQRWLSGSLERGGDARERKLSRVAQAIRFEAALSKDDPHAESVRRYLVDDVLRDLAWGHLGAGRDVDQATDAVATWLEQSFDKLPEATRARAMDILLGRGLKNVRLLEPTYRLSLRVVEQWARAGHPLPGSQRPIPRDFEVVVCPHPKDERDGRSLGPRCEGGIARLALATPAGTARLGSDLAARKDPVLLEHVMVSAGYGTYGGDERKLVTLLRAVENDPTLLRVALRVIAEDHAHGATLELWLAESRRLWLARPNARGSLLYLLGHLDPYGNGKIDFSDFAGGFGAPVGAAEAKLYFDEGYRALSLAHVVWPAFARGYSRASLIRPILASYLDDSRVRQFRMRDPHESLVQIRHRLCDEEAEGDLRALGAAIAAEARAKPGRSLDELARSFDPKTCDPPCAELRQGTCIRRMSADELARRKRERGQR